MGGGEFSPDDVVFYDWGVFRLNATIVYTWVVMAILVIGSWLITRRLTTDRRVSRWQNLLEVVVGFLRREIRNVSRQDPDAYLPFIGTLFIFIALSNVLDVVPGFTAPTGSLSTTAALAVCVFLAVPLYGVANCGAATYLRNYVRPSPFMLPFNIIGELSRTLALAVRLVGNVMSGTKVAAVLLSLVPLVLPVAMHVLGLLIGLIQAYIFALLAMVYISSGMRAQQTKADKAQREAGAPQPTDAEPPPGEPAKAEQAEAVHEKGSTHD